MRLRALLYPVGDRSPHLALLLVRIAAGLVLAPHGIYKLLDGARGIGGMLASRGVPAAPVLAWCAALAESFGAVLVAIGLLTRPAAATACIAMAVAWSTAHLGDAPLVGTSKGAAFEYPFLLSLIYLAFVIAGPGRLSLDARLFGPKDGR